MKLIISFTACMLYVLPSVEKAGCGKMNHGISGQGRYIITFFMFMFKLIILLTFYGTIS